MTINWGTIHALENDFYTKVSRIKQLTFYISQQKNEEKASNNERVVRL